MSRSDSIVARTGSSWSTATTRAEQPYDLRLALSPEASAAGDAPDGLLRTLLPTARPTTSSTTSPNTSPNTAHRPPHPCICDTSPGSGRGRGGVGGSQQTAGRGCQLPWGRCTIVRHICSGAAPGSGW